MKTSNESFASIFTSPFRLLHLPAVLFFLDIFFKFFLFFCRYSSQEDFRGSSKSLAIYPSDLHSSTLDMHERSSPHQPHPRFAPRSRMGGSRESLDVQMQNRESRSLSRSFPAGAPGVQGGGAGVRQQRASSLPPPEDHLGEDEQVLSLVQPLSSSIVPSLVNTLVRHQFKLHKPVLPIHYKASSHNV